MRYQVSKTLSDFPCVHRCWQHTGKCRLLHGYDRSFTLTFEAVELDPVTGFVLDFSDMKDIKQLLDDQFDHTTIVAADDPVLPQLKELAELGVVDLRIMDHPGMEGAAKWTLEQISELLSVKTNGRVSLVAVEARENYKNAATVFSDRP
jgi:6-pyruvoyltetrahydropterin/6-carboxytetrahydropterin synthase